MYLISKLKKRTPKDPKKEKEILAKLKAFKSRKSFEWSNNPQKNISIKRLD